MSLYSVCVPAVKAFMMPLSMMAHNKAPVVTSVNHHTMVGLVDKIKPRESMKNQITYVEIDMTLTVSNYVAESVKRYMDTCKEKQEPVKARILAHDGIVEQLHSMETEGENTVIKLRFVVVIPWGQQ